MEGEVLEAEGCLDGGGYGCCNRELIHGGSVFVCQEYRDIADVYVEIVLPCKQAASILVLGFDIGLASCHYLTSTHYRRKCC